MPLMLRSTGFGFALASALLLAAPDADAFSITVGYAGNDSSFVTMTDQDAYLGCGGAGAQGQLSCSGTNWTPLGGWTLDSWSLQVDPDPSITNIFSVTNNTAATQTFVVSVLLPTGISFGPPSLIRGSVQGGATVTGPSTVPTMYVWSDGDTALGPDAAAATADYVTGPYRFEALEGVNHWIPEQAPDDLNDLLLDFLAGQGPL